MAVITQINGGGSNCYLITENHKSILVDTGRKSHAKAILDACKGYNVTLIILTHGHIDHAQNAAYLSENLKAPVAINKKDIPLLNDNLCREMKSKGLLGNIVRFFSEQSAKNEDIEKFHTNVFLDDGNSLLEYGIYAKVIALPGHAEGSIGIQVGDNDLIVGDALMNMFTPSITLLYENREQMLLSVQKIEKLGKKKIYFGHGNPVMNRKWIK